MINEPTIEAAELYRQGLQHFGQARWAEAIQCWSQLETISTAYPEIGTLLADAQIKLEYERLSTPVDKPQPRARPRTVVLGSAAAALLALVMLVLGFNALTQTSVVAAPPVQAMIGALPTVAPTRTPIPTVVPTAVPTPTPEPTLAPVPTRAPSDGTVLVRMAAGQRMTRPVENLYLILDASGSMLGEVGQRRRIDIAHEALSNLVNGLPDTSNVALRTYGRQRSGDCTDVELVTPLAPLNRDALNEQIRGIVPKNRSRTPLALSLDQVAGDLQNARGETLVVLLSDGDETCDGIPEDAAARLHAANPNIRVSVIGFDIGPQEWRTRLQAIAEQGGGEYFEAGNAEQLLDALRRAVTPTYRILDAAGNEITRANLGTFRQLPNGAYTIEINGTSLVRLEGIAIGGGRTTVIELREEGTALRADVVASDLPDLTP